jgi:hypothetical protein
LTTAISLFADDEQAAALGDEAVAVGQRGAAEVDLADGLRPRVDPEQLARVGLHDDEQPAVVVAHDAVGVEAVLVDERRAGEVEPRLELADAVTARRGAQDDRPHRVGDVRVAARDRDVVDERLARARLAVEDLQRAAVRRAQHEHLAGRAARDEQPPAAVDLQPDSGRATVGTAGRKRHERALPHVALEDRAVVVRGDEEAPAARVDRDALGKDRVPRDRVDARAVAALQRVVGLGARALVAALA